VGYFPYQSLDLIFHAYESRVVGELIGLDALIFVELEAACEKVGSGW